MPVIAFTGLYTKNYNPNLHDSIGGPAEEFAMFNPMGFSEAEIGVGLLAKGRGKTISFTTITGSSVPVAGILIGVRTGLAFIRVFRVSAVGPTTIKKAFDSCRIKRSW